MSESEPPTGPEQDWEPAWDPDTGPQPTRSAPRSHRAPPQFGRLLAPLAAVGVVIVVIALLVWINGRPSGVTSAAVVGGVSSPTPPTVVLASPPQSTPPATPSSPSASPTHTTHPKPARTSAAPHPSHSTHPSTAVAMARVQVLNNSRRHGLAHEVASEIAAKGWQIGIVGNLRGLISESTVFYSPGEKAAAQHLASEFAGIRRVEPNSAAHLTATGITVVLTADWAD